MLFVAFNALIAVLFFAAIRHDSKYGLEPPARKPCCGTVERDRSVFRAAAIVAIVLGVFNVFILLAGRWDFLMGVFISVMTRFGMPDDVSADDWDTWVSGLTIAFVGAQLSVYPIAGFALALRPSALYRPFWRYRQIRSDVSE